MTTNIKNIAIVSANGLGDGLLSLAMAHNLEKKYQVTTFSNYMLQLRYWFPEKNIEPFPEIDAIDKTFAIFDKIISTDGAFLARIKRNFSDRHAIFYERDFDRSKTVLENFLVICQKEFGLTDVDKQNGLVVPVHLQFRKYQDRVIIHPMSTSSKKNWSAEKFIKLAEELQHKKFQPVFAVSTIERSEWQEKLRGKFPLPLFADIDQLARYVYESGYMIGNDSGIGHLASNLNIPTVSLFSRGSVARLWRPGWGNGIVVTPTLQLPGARLRTKHWQTFLTVDKVLSSFESLTKKAIK